MKRYWAMKWASDLETRGRKQAKGTLRKGNAYCCLGRACIVAGMKPDEIDGMSLPPEVQKKFGMHSSEGSFRGDGGLTHLSFVNDNGKSFKEIAQIIRKNWREL